MQALSVSLVYHWNVNSVPAHSYLPFFFLVSATLFDCICDTLLILVSFLQFEKREKHPCGSVASVKLWASDCNFTKSNTPPIVFFSFLKLFKGYQIAQRFSYLRHIFIIQPSNFSLQNVMSRKHSANNRGGGFCIYYIDSFPVKLIVNHYLKRMCKFQSKYC